jgi:hypothetical protein
MLQLLLQGGNTIFMANSCKEQLHFLLDRGVLFDSLIQLRLRRSIVEDV